MTNISGEEKLRRHRIVESSIGTNAMEGQMPDALTRDILRQFEEGELNLERFSSAMDSHAHELFAKHGDMAGAA